MSSLDTNGLPPQPEGVTTVETGIVPACDVRPRTRMSQSTIVWVGYFACALAGAFSPYTAIISSMLAGYSTLMLTVVRDSRVAMMATGTGCVAAVVASLLIGVEVIPSAVLTLLVASAIGIGLGTGRLTSSAACMLCIVAALAYLCIDIALAALAGTSLTKLVMAQIDTMFSSLSDDSSGLGASIAAVRTVVGYIWPSSYTLNALVGIIAAALGGRWARTSLGPLAPRTLTFTAFDLPIWVAGALLGCIVGFAVAQAIPAGDALLMVVVNVALAVRFAFGVSGTAVAAHFMRRRGLGILATLAISGILVLIDMQLFVMAIVGLVDFWANFRRLPRGAQPAQAKA